MSSSGYLQLGTAIDGAVVVTPASGTNYAGQPITFDAFTGGIQLSNVNCVFGPVSGSWGTLTCFGVTEDVGGAIPVVPPGTLQAPFTPLNQQLVVVPPGDISLVVGAQFAAGPGAFIAGTTPASTSSGSVALTSGVYSLVVGEGSYRLLSVQNTSQVDSVFLRIGDASQPVSGAAPSVVLPPYQSWPPQGNGVVPTGPVWGAAATRASGTVASYLTA